MPMLKATEMRILTSNEPKELQDQVNRLLASDWAPHGTLQVVLGAVQFTYVQALVKMALYEPPGTGQVLPVGAGPSILMR